MPMKIVRKFDEIESKKCNKMGDEILNKPPVTVPYNNNKSPPWLSG